jgi:hypothetical protein
MARPLALVALLAVPLLGGCGSGTALTLRVTDPAGAPVEAAFVEAVALDSGDVPLPINDDSIAEITTETRLAAWTDAEGLARLTLISGRDHRLWVDPPPLDERAGEPAARAWRLDAGSRTLVPLDAGAAPPGLRLEVLD